jgi:alkylation response protein AidB-like acyl-CoA dehydrogenase
VAQPLNRYKADLRDFHFLLFEQFGLQDLLGKAPYADWGVEEVKAVLDEVYKFATQVSGPLAQIGDQEGCKLVDGRVKTPTGFANAWKRVYEAGWKQLAVPTEYGGQGSPVTLQMAADELLSGSNTAWAMYAGLTLGAAELIESFGTKEQKALFCEKMLQGTWAGTMCLTEPHAGSDVGDAKTTASRNPDGSFKIKGTKIFISGGDNDFTPNVVHMVLARIDGAPAGTKGLSLFIVPAVHVKADGSLGERNDVQVASIEHKMGINGSATCVLNFGENDACIGYLTGGAENQGMPQMFQMMNGARIGVGIQGLAAASSAYLNALEYAKDRKQGPSMKAFKDPTAPKVPIIEHADVRRMMLDMKSKVEGIRALCIYLTLNWDRAMALKGVDDDAAAYAQGQVELLTPIFKAYGTDQGFQVCATAIQSYGGAGFLKDHPVEQYCRDARIFAIYEGTNHIQSLDLVGRKLRMNGGQYARDLLDSMTKLVEKHSEHPELGPSIQILGEATQALGGALMNLMMWVQNDLEMIPLYANRIQETFSEVTVAWLLLDGAVVALSKAKELPASHPDHAFYQGKRYSAQYYAQNILPNAIHRAKEISRADRSALDIPLAGFASI